MKKLKKCFTLILASIMLMAMSTTAYARWDYLVLISGTIDIDSWNNAHIEVVCGADGGDVDKQLKLGLKAIIIQILHLKKTMPYIKAIAIA